MNDLFTQHVGYTSEGPDGFFSPETVAFISSAVITFTREHVDPRGVLVPDNTIIAVMNQVYRGFRPATGDIYSRYVIPPGPMEPSSYLWDLIGQCVKAITDDIQNQWTTDRQNSALSIWTTVLGEGNPHGLRQTPPIKTLKKRPRTGLFHYNY